MGPRARPLAFGLTCVASCPDRVLARDPADYCACYSAQLFQPTDVTYHDHMISLVDQMHSLHKQLKGDDLWSCNYRSSKKFLYIGLLP